MTSEKAILAGGCFWGMQDLIRKLPGVTSTRVGYTGGDVPNATYRNHHGHAEAIEITFDPEKISYRDLLEFYLERYPDGYTCHFPHPGWKLPRRAHSVAP
jgi:peptide-methionine (S)-S-oxide reductase